MLKVSIFIILAMSMMLGITAITEPYPTAYAGKDYKKELCKENGGEWEDGACDFKADDEDKADQFSDEQTKIEKFEEERAAEEDALCDDEDAETTNIELCKSDDLTLGEVFASREADPYDEEAYEDQAKEVCNSYEGANWEEGECKFNDSEEGEAAAETFGDECESNNKKMWEEYPDFCDKHYSDK